ncbi:unnamed protein product [Parajaminaea phylloscopi]
MGRSSDSEEGYELQSTYRRGGDDTVAVHRSIEPFHQGQNGSLPPATQDRAPPRALRQRRPTNGGSDVDEELDNEQGSEPSAGVRPPSFAESQFQTIIRRQRKRRILSAPLERIEAGQVRIPRPTDRQTPTKAGQNTDQRQEAVKRPDEPFFDHKGALLKVGSTRGSPARAGPANSYQFAGWGSMLMLEATEAQYEEAAQKVAARGPRILLDQFRAMAIAGNAVVGSIFYALPSVFAVSGVWTPVALVLAAVLMTPVLIVIDSLASGLSATNAGSYTYMLNVTGRTLALVAGAITILDAVSTGAVSSLTAASYAASATDKLSMTVFTVLFLVGLTTVCLLGLRDSSALALSIFTFHTCSILALIVVSAIAACRTGSHILVQNWHDALSIAGSAANLAGKSIARSIFDGTVVAFVGLTGFETTVSYAGAVKPGHFRKALRNIWIVVTLLEAPAALLALTLIPFGDIVSANSVLARLASVSGGRAFQTFIVVDAAVVLCGGILTGAISCSGVLLAMSHDGTLPSALARVIPRTGAPVWCLAAYLALCVVMCATASFSQLTVSSIFSIVFLAVLTLFGMAAVLVLFSRPFLPRKRISLLTMIISLGITITAFVGNVILSPLVLGQTVAYAAIIAAVILTWHNRVPLVRVFGAWLPAQFPVLLKVIPGLEKKAATWVQTQRRQTRAVFMTNTDELSALVSAILYVQENEPSVGHVILAHCYSSNDAADVPAELESNHQLVDEAFPTITVDLVFLEVGRRGFGPEVLEVLSTLLEVPLSRFLIACPTSATATIAEHDCSSDQLPTHSTTAAAAAAAAADHHHHGGDVNDGSIDAGGTSLPPGDGDAAPAQRRKYRLQDLGSVRIILD